VAIRFKDQDGYQQRGSQHARFNGVRTRPDSSCCHVATERPARESAADIFTVKSASRYRAVAGS
jgi:hypothetical protein